MFRIPFGKYIFWIILFCIVFGWAWLYSPSRWNSSQFYFDKDASPQILELIESAKKSIFIQMFMLTRKDYVKSLEKRFAGGVDVRVIVDNNKENEPLLNAKFPVRWETSSKLFHRKLAIVDSQWIWIGSTNWTYGGTESNAEVDLLMSSPDHAVELRRQFEKDWVKMARRQK